MVKTKAPSDEGAVDCKLTERQFTFYKSTEGGKNYLLDELIGYYLIYLHYIIIPTTPNLSKIFQSKGQGKTNLKNKIKLFSPFNF